MSGNKAARVGDKVSKGVIVTGSATVLIGDAGEGKADRCPTCEPAVDGPVNPILGVKLLPVETDFALAAPSPFAFTRAYLSSDTRIGALGQGWSIPGEGLGFECTSEATTLIDARSMGSGRPIDGVSTRSMGSVSLILSLTELGRLPVVAWKSRPHHDYHPPQTGRPKRHWARTDASRAPGSTGPHIPKLPDMTSITEPTTFHPSSTWPDDPFSGPALVALRKRLGLNQAQFWRRFSIKQSGASRYESGRRLPGPVRLLLTLATVDEAQALAMLQSLRKPEAPPPQHLDAAHIEASAGRGGVVHTAHVGVHYTMQAAKAISLRAGEHVLSISAEGALTLDGTVIAQAVPVASVPV